MFEITDKQINLLVDGKVAGYIIYDEKDYVIMGIYLFVEKEYRQKGYSLLLVDELVKFAQNKNKKITPICSVIKRTLETKYMDIIK